MDKEEYKRKIRLYRGHLKSMNNELDLLYDNACDEFINFTLGNKDMGISKMSYIVNNMNKDKQLEFIKWMSEGKRNKNSIDLKLLEMI